MHTPAEAIAILRGFVKRQEHKGACVGLAEACLDDLEKALPHTCEVGLECPVAYLEHLRTMPQEDIDAINKLFNPTPPPGCDRGTMVNQNLPDSLRMGWRIDSELPPGTIEVWQDGKRIGRIKNIGKGR